jgi:hypothetical protein
VTEPLYWIMVEESWDDRRLRIESVSKDMLCEWLFERLQATLAHPYQQPRLTVVEFGEWGG